MCSYYNWCIMVKNSLDNKLYNNFSGKYQKILLADFLTEQSKIDDCYIDTSDPKIIV